MNVRTKAAAASIAVMMTIPVAASTATAADAYPPGSKTLKCNVTTTKAKSKIKVNVNPNQPGKRFYKFRIDVNKKGEWSWFRQPKKYKTKGRAEKRTVNVPKGTYRVKCYGKFGYNSAISKTVKIKK